MSRLDPKELRRISSASRAERVAATRAKKEQIRALSKSIEKVWKILVLSALSGNRLFVIRNLTEEEVKVIRDRFGLYVRRETTRDGEKYTIDLNSIKFESWRRQRLQEALRRPFSCGF